jgi:Invasin, domain 3
MSTDTAAGLTVTPIFWEPVGGHYVFPPKYESVIDGYVQNVAAASGSEANVYSVDTEYYDVPNDVPTFIKYNIHAGGPIVDTDLFPPSGCHPAPGYKACITDLQLRTELTLITTNLKLPTNLAHFYPVFFPPGVETVDVDGTNSYDGFCGYHRAFGTNADKTVYADMPYEANACNAGQAPNGNLAADAAVSTLSHELNDAITDPLELDHAWIDLAGNEIADMCDQAYGRPLGSTNPSDPAGSEYNQVINGGTYYTQEMFSNLAYEKYGAGRGCTLSEALVENLDADGLGTQPNDVASTFAAASPDVLPADAKATSTIVVTVTDLRGGPVAGDHVHFSTALKSGSGVCGHLSHTEVTTDGNGAATVTYKASGWNVSCWVVAVEAKGGQAAESVIYQGVTGKDVPPLNASFPPLLKAGAAPTTFTLHFGNSAASSMPYARLDLAVLAGAQHSPNVDAKQVHLSYSMTGPKGRFTNVPLTGATGGGAQIDGHLGPQQGSTLPPSTSKTVTFRVALSSSAPVDKSGPLIAFKAYLDQVNSASGSRSTLAATSAANVSVPTAAPNNTMWYAGIGAAVIVAVVLAIVLLLLWRRHRRRRQEPPAAATT